jgi:hypothetical protein
MSFERRPIISCVETRSYWQLVQSLRQEAFKVLELDGETITDAQSLFAEINRKLPLDPPLSGRVNWDALSDSLWGGLEKLGRLEWQSFG